MSCLRAISPMGSVAFFDYARETYDAPIPKYVRDELRAYLRCGIFEHGFLRARCEKCQHDLLVAFSCKARGLCPSCAGRRMANTAAHVVDRIIPVVPVRQWVLSLPFDVRAAAAYDAQFLSAVVRAFATALRERHRRFARAAGIDRSEFAAITFVQRFGSSPVHARPRAQRSRDARRHPRRPRASRKARARRRARRAPRRLRPARPRARRASGRHHDSR